MIHNNYDNLLSEYTLLKEIPEEDWLLFITYTYGDKYNIRDKSDDKMKREVEGVFGNLAYELGIPFKSIGWFMRVEIQYNYNSSNQLPRHIHGLLHKNNILKRYNKLTNSPFTIDTLIKFLTEQWTRSEEHTSELQSH